MASPRSHYPSLDSPTVFLDNAGGSQVPRCVADAMHHYLLNHYVQIGADYEVSRRATAIVAWAHRFLKTFVNAPPGGEIIIGPSTSQLCATLANAYAQVLTPGDEVVICETAHESNAGPWARLAARGFGVRVWRVDPATGRTTVDGLRAVLTARTKIVAFPQVSNILGEVVDVKPVVDLVHDAGARAVVDGVAFAPHRAVDVSAWDVDWYVYSTYKVFGPHQAVLYGKGDALAGLTGPNHDFIPRGELPRKFELGGVNHECAAGILALDSFLRDFVGVARQAPGADVFPLTGVEFDRAVVTRAFCVMEELETPLQARLLEYLRGKKSVRIIGPNSGGRERVCIVSFRHAGKPSREIARAANEVGLGIRYGHFYAHRLCKAMGLDPDSADGSVVRVSFAHYNTLEECDRLIEFFERHL